ncbi:hypothetical protein [Paracoccus siganidrum]|uniref:hypothetical protein n=1 Tax=Paracoccus siganidrum TaxID=1276757 RepID=UPI001F0BBEA2|nr:hypothetical protein [Paracoccus siganidrum]
MQRHRLAAQGLDFRDDLGSLGGIAAIGQDDVAAMAGNRKRGVAAEATVAPVTNAILLMSFPHVERMRRTWRNAPGFGCPFLAQSCLFPRNRRIPLAGMAGFLA